MLRIRKAKPAPVAEPEQLSTADIKAIKSLAGYLEQIKFDQYVESHSKFHKVLWYNLLAGIARGFGYIIGATVLIAYFWLLLNWLGGLPWIGKLVAQIIRVVEQQGI